MSTETRERVLKLMQDKERIENEIEQLTDVLKKVICIQNIST